MNSAFHSLLILLAILGPLSCLPPAAFHGEGTWEDLYDCILCNKKKNVDIFVGKTFKIWPAPGLCQLLKKKLGQRDLAVLLLIGFKPTPEQTNKPNLYIDLMGQKKRYKYVFINIQEQHKNKWRHWAPIMANPAVCWAKISDYQMPNNQNS